MAAESQTTSDHEEIRRWAESRGGRPARVQGTGSSDDPGLIRLMFPDAPQAEDENLEEISWDEWFDALDRNNLALVYEETTSDGQESRFNKIVSRERVTQES
jgi:hypothetical protein